MTSPFLKKTSTCSLQQPSNLTPQVGHVDLAASYSICILVIRYLSHSLDL